MASTNIKPKCDYRNIYCSIVTILFFVIFSSILCNIASAYTYTGAITSIGISPSTIHSGDSITHSITVINTGTETQYCGTDLVKQEAIPDVTVGTITTKVECH